MPNNTHHDNCDRCGQFDLLTPVSNLEYIGMLTDYVIGRVPRCSASFDVHGHVFAPTQTRHWCSECVAYNAVPCRYTNTIIPLTDAVNILGTTTEYVARCVVRNQELRICTNASCGQLYTEDTPCRWCEPMSNHNERRLENTRQEESVIEGYHAVRNFKKLGEDSQLFFGLELEFEMRSKATSTKTDIAKKARELFGELCATVSHDGSLQNGAEIVTQPATLSYLYKNFPEVDQLKQLGAAADSRAACGMHIHFSKNQLSKLHRCKLDALFTSERTDWTRIFRRLPNNYCQVPPTPRLNKSFCAPLYTDRLDRYRMLNHKPQHTIELRSPRGSLTKDTILATVEILNAAITFSKIASFKELTLGNLIKFINAPENRKTTIFARNYLHKLNFDVFVGKGKPKSKKVTRAKSSKPRAKKGKADAGWTILSVSRVGADVQSYQGAPENGLWSLENLPS